MSETSVRRLCQVAVRKQGEQQWTVLQPVSVSPLEPGCKAVLILGLALARALTTVSALLLVFRPGRYPVPVPVLALAPVLVHVPLLVPAFVHLPQSATVPESPAPRLAEFSEQLFPWQPLEPWAETKGSLQHQWWGLAGR